MSLSSDAVPSPVVSSVSLVDVVEGVGWEEPSVAAVVSSVEAVEAVVDPVDVTDSSVDAGWSSGAAFDVGVVTVDVPTAGAAEGDWVAGDAEPTA